MTGTARTHPDGTTTRLLHRLTSYEPDRDWTQPIPHELIVTDLEVNDLDRWPLPYKSYDERLPRIDLPRDLTTGTLPATSVLAGTATAPSVPLDLTRLATVLHLSAGVTRTGARPGRTILFRAAGSAGARFPLEVYLAVPTGGALPAGVHWYHPLDHALIRIGPPPTGTAPALIVTGVPWRTGWRYRERGWRHIYWDAGTLVSQLLALAASAGVAADLYSRFPDEEVAALVGADGAHEFPVAVIGLGGSPTGVSGGSEPALRPTGTATTGAVDRDPLEFPLVTAAQHAGDRDRFGTAWPPGDPITLSNGPDASKSLESVESVVRRRGSQRRMDRERSVPRAVLVDAVGAALRGIDVPHWVAVHAVDTVPPGLYRWPDLDHPVRSGDLRDELARVCLDQQLAAEAAYVVIGATAIGDLDDRQYREAQLAAGIVEGRLHLMAYALGATATGMTFLDSEIPALLDDPVDGLLFTCVGVPEYTSRTGGPPGSPVSVAMVTPR